MSCLSISQQTPTGTAAGGIQWRRGGNTTGGGTNNLFGTSFGFNSPIYTITNGLNRTRLNGTLTNTVNGFNQPRDGYFLLGFSQGFSAPLFNGANRGAFSLFHLNGSQGTFIQEGGYRPWMRTGISLTDNNDFSYFGLRKVGAGTDLTETTITWSDNGGAGFPGPDDLVFRFTSGGFNQTATFGNQDDPTDVDGRNVARFTAEGLMGLGSTFGSGAGPYVRPAEQFHSSRRQFQQNWGLITNELGTGQTANDGLKWGIRQTNYFAGDGRTYGFVRWQENSALIFQSDWNNTPGFGAQDGERIRITSVGSLVADGNYLGITAPANTTRVAISHDGNNPVLRPMSLLHLGYDVGNLGTAGVAVDGWRPWMDVGMSIVNASDNMYVGLKPEGTDRQDAVINWGDNQVPGVSGPVGPDNLRFIFTSTTTALPPGTGDPASQSADGLEIARMEPGIASTLVDSVNMAYGMMGIGDFSPGSQNDATGERIDAKLDIDGDLRIRAVTEDTTESDLVLVIDTNDLNRVHWRNANDLGGFGSVCSDTTPKFLAEDSRIYMNNFNFHFTDSASQQPFNNVGIGTDCDTALLAKLQVQNQAMQFGVAARTVTDSVNVNYGVAGEALNASSISAGCFGRAVTPGPIRNYGVWGRAANATQLNIAGNFEILNSTVGSNFGVSSLVNSATTFANFGVTSVATQSSVQNIGGRFSGFGIGSSVNYGVQGNGSMGSFTGGSETYGGHFFASASDLSYGIYAEGTDAAGYFQGDIFHTGAITPVSDQAIKTNIEDLDSALSIIQQLKPKTYEFDTANYSHLRLSAGNQFGLIAQDVETVLPELVETKTVPAVRDTNGTILTPAIDLKTLEYEAFIPILIQGMKEQNEVIQNQNEAIESRDSLINDLAARLQQLEDCVASVGLCSGSSAIQEQMGENTNGQTNQLDVELNDAQNIVLEQNVPNPFAEQTTIAYEIPETVHKAQILFYNHNGQLINSVEIQEKGHGSLNVFANDLSSGVYTYTLIADGEIIATKKMVKQN